MRQMPGTGDHEYVWIDIDQCRQPLANYTDQGLYIHIHDGGSISYAGLEGLNVLIYGMNREMRSLVVGYWTGTVNRLNRNG